MGIRPADYTDEIIESLRYKVITPNLATQTSYQLPIQDDYTGYYKVIGVKTIQPQGSSAMISEKPFSEDYMGWAVPDISICNLDAAATVYISVARHCSIEVQG